MKKSFRSWFLVGFAVLFAGVFTAALLPYVNAGKDRRKSQRAAPRVSAATGGISTVLINEIDSDTPGTDIAEFVELKSDPGASLTGYAVVFYRGDTDISYRAFDLDGFTTDANGILTIGNSAVPGVDITFAGGVLRNGSDAVAIYLGDGSSFPNGTAVTTTNLVDAVVYDTDDADDPELLALLAAGAAQVQVNENGAGSGTGPTNSIRRCSDEARDGRAFSVGLPTPDRANSNCANGPVDLNGDGRTDYLIVRQSGGAAANITGASSVRRPRQTMRERLRERAFAAVNGIQAGSVPVQWLGANSSDFGFFAAEFGDFLGDHLLTADYDGDGKDDITVWRPFTDGSYFYSLNSSDFTLRQVHFGGPFDNPYVVGDYDGDGIDDPATYRCPLDDPGPCYFFYRPSSTPATEGEWVVQWGNGTEFDILPFPGDFDGDGTTDFVIQVESPTTPGNALFYIITNGTWDFSAIEWGSISDFLIPGDFDGDGKADITVTRLDENDALWWYIYEQDGGIQFVSWGNGFDYEVPGDYDGDGRDDIAIYRENATDATFWVLPSNGSPHLGVTWGAPGDYPMANTFVAR